VGALRELEGVEDLKGLFRIQGRLRQLRDIANLPKANAKWLNDYEKLEAMEKLKERGKTWATQQHR